MVDFQNRKKVYILCGKEEYSTIWEHLNEIINVQEEELIIPYDFMEYEKIDDRIEQNVFTSLKEGLKNEDEVRLWQYAKWYERKFIHFKNYAPMTSEIIITKNFVLSDIDAKEKAREIKYCNNLKFKTIKVIDMKKLTHQKTIK